MRIAALVGLIVISFVTIAGAIEVAGVKVRGRTASVSVADIRQAVTTGIGTGRTASSAEVVTRDEIRVYLDPPELGWIPVSRQRVSHVDGSTLIEWHGTVKSISEPDVLACIKGADHVYAFPVAKPLRPHRDKTQMRLLDSRARSEVVGLLGTSGNWYEGFYKLIIADEGQRGLGLVFRRGRDEVVLFWSQITRVEGTFNGRYINGLLDDRTGKPRMERWLRRYAPREFPFK